MLLIGFLPLILVPFVLWEWPLPDGGMWSTSFNYLTGVLHVGMTVAFYVDPELHQFRAERKRVFVGWPIGTIVITALAFATLPLAGRELISVAFAIWLAHHYTGQQIGVASLMLASKNRSLRLDPLDRRVIRSTQVLSTIGLIRSSGYGDTFLDGVPFRAFCLPVFAALLITTLVVLVRGNGRAQGPLRTVSLVWSLAFVAPFALLSHPFVASATAAAVHGFHYVYLVALVTGGGRGRFGWMPSIVGGATIAGVYVLVPMVATHGMAARMAPALLLGIVAAHRAVDAHVWRMRDPDRLAYLRRGLAWL